MSYFEFDPEKSRINYEKHGIDFNAAQHIFDDEGLAIIDGTSKTEARDVPENQRFGLMKKITAEEFDRRFDAGEDMSEFLDWNSLRPFHGPNKKPLERGVKRKASVKAPSATRKITKTG